MKGIGHLKHLFKNNKVLSKNSSTLSLHGGLLQLFQLISTNEELTDQKNCAGHVKPGPHAQESVSLSTVPLGFGTQN